MKKMIMVVFATLCCSFSFAQKPEKVYPYSKVQEAPEWYAQQEKAWTSYLSKNPKDASAWYNLYYAKRLLAFHDPADKRSYEEKDADFKAFYTEVEKNIPNSYESNLIKWMIGGLDMSNIAYLNKAADLGENRTEHLDHMVNIAEISGQEQNRARYAKKQFETGSLSPGMLNYNYNVLMGLAENAILVTVGDNDTYPAWALQALGIRKDVTVINLSLLLKDDYRKRLFEQLGIQNISIDWKDNNVEQNFQKKVLPLMANNSKDYPFYIALTASHIIANAEPPIEDKLYLTGLAYQYCKLPINNTAILQHNFEHNFALDYLKQQFAPDISAELVDRMNLNYIVPMLKLYEQYKLAGNSQMQEWIKSYIYSLKLRESDKVFIKKHLS